MAKKKKQKQRVGRPSLNEKYNVPKGKKICGTCLEVKSTSEFHKHARTKDGLQPQCKQCGKKKTYEHRAANPEHYRQKNRENYANNPERGRSRTRKWYNKHHQGDKGKEYRRRAVLKREYDLTLEEFNEMLTEQNNQCALCGATKGGKTGDKNNLHIDHNHETGEIRSLLCIQCNRGLGCFGDDPQQLIQAALYLLKHDGDRKIARRLQSLLN